ncbi:MAG: hypothetical protein GYA57_02000 [Myxococcales bacterium]|nr:hypothetical protein [Myxococcales bacterium]
MRRWSACKGFALAPLVLSLCAAEADAATVTVGPNREILVDGEPFLPIMQWLQSPSRIEAQAALGINTFVGNGSSSSTSSDYLDECARRGVWGVMSADDLSVAGHAALLGWVFGDEPDLEGNAVEPATLLAEREAIRAADPNHVTFLTLTAGFYSEFDPPDWMGGSRSRYFDYPDATDMVGFDIYPVYGWCRPDWLYRVVAAQRELGETYAPGKATYQWIEAVRTSSQWCELSERGEDDGPTAEEIRNEVWQALVGGATAIGYFTHSWECPGYSQFCLSPAQEDELRRTNAQLTALTRPILAPSYAGVVADTGGARIEWTAKDYGGRVYLFAVNVDRTTATATWTVPGTAPGADVEVLDESRTIPIAGGAFSDDFAALAVHLYAVDRAGGPDADADADADTDADADGGGDGTADAAPDADTDVVADGGGDGAEAGPDGGEGDGDGGCGCRSAGRSGGGPVTLLVLFAVSVRIAARLRPPPSRRLQNAADARAGRQNRPGRRHDARRRITGA